METQASVKSELYPVQSNTESMQLFSTDPETAFVEAQRIVTVVSRRCSGPEYIVNINGKQYPKIEWWTSISASLGLFPQTVFSKRLEREDEVAYEARVEVHRNGQVISSGEALCSSKEVRWQGADEYAIKSMAITRASGKAYRIPLSFLAVMAGLEATPAEEMPVEPLEPNNQSGVPATQRQMEQLQRLSCDKRLTPDEQGQMRALLIDHPTKVQASRAMERFYGRSARNSSGEWIRLSPGILDDRSPVKREVEQ